MPADRAVKVIEHTVAGHKTFAGAAFFTRTSEEYYSAFLAVLFQIFLHGNSGSYRTSAQKVMAASMSWFTVCNCFLFCCPLHLAQSGERVKFTEKTDYRLPVAIGSGKSRLDSRQVSLDLKSLFFEEFAENIDRFKFLESRLRILPYPIACLADIHPFSLDGFQCFLFCNCHSNLLE